MKPRNAIKAVEGIVEAGEVVNPDYKTHQIALELIKKYNLSYEKKNKKKQYFTTKNLIIN